MQRKPLVVSTPGGYPIRVLGAQHHPLSDFYHALLRLPWGATVGTLAAAFLVTNAVYATAYAAGGGVANARPGSLADAFFFSVQTMGTIGYGAMYPVTPFANSLVVLESIASLILTALGTGLVFAKFSRPTARVAFTREAVVTSMDGVPTLSLRISNERGNQLVDAHIRIVLTRTVRTAEGHTFYRMTDLALARERTLTLSRSFTVLHPIDAGSPLFGQNAETLARDDAELQLLVTGLDDTTMQLVQALHWYPADRILWGMRHADVLTEEPDGGLVLDLRRFHDVEPAPLPAG